MSKLTTTEVKNILINELKNSTGFAPKKSEIENVEVWDDVATATIGGKKYGFAYEVKTEVSQFQLLPKNDNNPVNPPENQE